MKYPKNYPIVPLLPFRLNDNVIIRNVGLGCVNENINLGRSYVDKDINISNCVFSRYSLFSENGAVVFVYMGSYSMNINYSMFYNCDCSWDGGAIFFFSYNSYLRMICANRCSASWGHFAFLYVSQVNQVEYLSISNCSHTTSGSYSIRLDSGNQRVDKTNSSMNNADQVSGIGIIYPLSFTSSHCTFSNNMVSQSICIYFSSSIYSWPGTITMSFANIVNNNSQSQYGVFCYEGHNSIQMTYCIFHNNHFYLFCHDYGSFELSHSFIDHLSSLICPGDNRGILIETNNTYINRMTYQIDFFSSHHCITYMPAPSSTIAETMARTYDSECENSVLSSDGCLRKCSMNVNMNMFPIFISFVII